MKDKTIVTAVITFTKTDKLLIENFYSPRVPVTGEKLLEVFTQEAVSSVLEELWDDFYRMIDKGEYENGEETSS